MKGLFLHSLLATIVLLLLAAPAAAQEPEGEFLICYPNAPGSARSAGPIMSRFGQFLSDQTGRSLRARYFNALAPGEAWLKDHNPSEGIVSLAVFLRWQRQPGLEAIAHAERGGSSEERYRLLVRRDAAFKTLTDLKTLKRPARIWSAHLDDPRFATNVVFGGKLRVKDVRHAKRVVPAFAGGRIRIVSTTRALSVLRRLQRGQDYKGEPVDAVLVDATVWRGLQQLKRYKGVFRVLYTSPVLPTPPVVRFRSGDVKGSQALAKVLFGMKSLTEGAAIMKSIQVSAFTPPQAKRLAELVKLYEAKVE
ncbi:MAG: hypothetical protein JKY65_08460 [Planctomycetes bacterium]|nr:hypothetical protein [Planctomycetota bacterium]